MAFSRHAIRYDNQQQGCAMDGTCFTKYVTDLGFYVHSKATDLNDTPRVLTASARSSFVKERKLSRRWCVIKPQPQYIEGYMLQK